MRLISGRLFLVVLFIAALIHVTATQVCDSCYQDLCDNVVPGSCSFTNVDAGCASEANCSEANSMIVCRGNESQQLYSLDTTVPSNEMIENCAGTMDDRPLRIPHNVSVGFYIIEHFRFCTNASIQKILLVSTNSTSAEIMEDALEFHIYKRYRAGRHTGSLEPSNRDLFVEEFSFGVTLSHNPGLSVFEAVPIFSNSNPAHVSVGDYLGLTVRQNIGILGETVSPSGSEGVYINSTLTSCTGSDSDVFELNSGDLNHVSSPRILVEYMPATTTGSDGTSSVTPEDASSTSPTSRTNAATTITVSGGTTDLTVIGGSTANSNSTDSTANSDLTIIVAAASGGAVAIAIIIAVIIIVLMCFYFQQRKDSRHLDSFASNQFGSNMIDRISMSTYNSQYIENQQFRPPVNFRGVETVENPAAERDTYFDEQYDHDYHEPFEMNAARALPLLPRPMTPRPTTPRPTTVTNVHYGVPSGNGVMGSTLPPEPTSPQYQDPDELASTPIIQRNRKTFKNPLYSTTGEIDVEMQQTSYLGEALPGPIYDQPVELQLKNDSAANTPVSPVTTGLVADIYRESEEGEEQAFGIQYTIPVSAGPQSSSQTFGTLTDNEVHPYHELEPNSEVMPTTGHHYHLLDSQLQVSGHSLDDNDGGSLLRSNVHNIVNESGAYVPTADERKKLFPNNTLSVEKFDTWKKASYKAKKFFVKMEEFWVPSKEENMLYQQLNQKKFREIMKDQLVFESHLGQGQFGSVQKAKWNCSGGSRDVAVKIMKPSALDNAKIKFLQEGAILGQFFHSNVIKLFGLVTLNNPVMIVMEYMQLGDLQSYLVKNYKPSGAAPPHPKTLLSFCHQIACGMKYLSRMHFVHRDLAARNIFVSETLVCKVGDFGMSRNLLDEEYYISHGGVVPVKWTAPEGLNYKKYSTASDVYSYGMVLYEIWSLGEKPLKDVPQEQVAIVTLHGYCQPPPPGTPRKIYSIMVQCWNPEHSKRPSFDEVFELLNGSDNDLLNWSDRDLEKMSSPHSRNIGSLMEFGDCLYKDLQNTYHGITPDMI